MKTLTTLFALLLFVSSCTKELVETPDPPGVIPAPRLTKAFSIDSTRPAPFDTAGRAVYSYDSQNRPSMITGVNFKAGGDTGYFSRFTYFYNGTDTLASKSIEYRYTNFTGTPSEITDTIIYTCSNGKLQADSTFSNASRVSKKYTYEPGIVRYVQKRYLSNTNALQSTSTRVIHMTVVNNNITHQVDTFATGTGPATYYTRFETSASYVDNPNPFAVFSRPVKRPYMIDDDITAVDYAPEKLWSSHSFVYSSWGASTGSSSTGVAYTYEFLANGYPSKIRLVRQDGTRNTMVLQYE